MHNYVIFMLYSFINLTCHLIIIMQHARLLFDPTLGVVDDRSLTFTKEEMAVAEEPRASIVEHRKFCLKHRASA